MFRAFFFNMLQELSPWTACMFTEPFFMDYMFRESFLLGYGGD
jgi:hypothetical protein